MLSSRFTLFFADNVDDDGGDDGGESGRDYTCLLLYSYTNAAIHMLVLLLSYYMFTCLLFIQLPFLLLLFFILFFFLT